jgi:hypothetical protein
MTKVRDRSKSSIAILAMNSALLALFVRSLREDARGQAAYRARTGLCVFILIILMALAASDIWTGAPGKTFFISIISLHSIAITFVGLSYFTSAIAEEKEEQTLGLLRMTDLNPLSILLGKSTSRLCGAMLLLAAQIPFTVVAVTLGGISLGQIAAAYCTLGAYTFLLCNVALLGSVLARRTFGAAVFSVLVIALLLSAGPLLGVLAHKLQSRGMSTALDGVAGMLWNATPIARLFEVLGTGFSGSPIGCQVASNLVFGAACFLLAWALFERFCDRASEEAGKSPDKALRTLNPRPHRQPRPHKHPLAWKDYHFLYGGKIGLRVRTCGYVGILVIAVCYSFAGGTSVGISSAAFQLVAFIFSIDIAAMAGRIFRSELNEQTLAALAGLPATTRELVYGKGRAFLLVAAPGALALIGVDLLQLLLFYMDPPGVIVPSGMVPRVLSRWVGAILLVHVVAWFSLSMKRGAFPIGYVATSAFKTVIGIVCLAIATAMGFAFNSGFFAMAFSSLLNCVASLVVIVILHRATLRRLEALAGEG